MTQFVQNLTNAVSNTASSITNAASNTASSISQAVDAVGDAPNQLSQASTEAGQGISGAAGQLSDAFDAAVDTPSGATIGNLCNTLNMLPETLLNAALGPYVKKIIQYQRIAQKILASAESIVLPDISQLLPLSQINANTFQQLASACPQLGLNKLAGGAGGIENEVQNLQQTVGEAYERLASALQQNPLSHIPFMQDDLNSLLDQAVGALTNRLGGDVSSLMQCVQALCGAAAAGASAYQSVLTSVSSNSDSNGYPQILQTAGQQTLANFQNLGNQISALIDTPTFVTAASQQAANPPAVGSSTQPKTST